MPVTPERLLAVVEIELERILKRLIACRNQQYREIGTYQSELGAAIERTEFLLRDLMTGLVTPAESRTRAARKDAWKINPTWIQ